MGGDLFQEMRGPWSIRAARRGRRVSIMAGQTKEPRVGSGRAEGGGQKYAGVAGHGGGRRGEASLPGVGGEVFDGEEDDLVDALAVEVDDFDVVAVVAEGFAFGGDVAEVFHDEAGEGLVVARRAGV
jgi:hypothetical protein